MLKACWDCIAGAAANRSPVYEEANGIHLTDNASRQSPVWPAPRSANEMIYVLPKAIEEGDSITVTGLTVTDRKSLVVNLLTESGGQPDYTNVAARIHCDFTLDNWSLSSIVNNQISEDIPPPVNLSSSIARENFAFTFRATSDGIETYVHTNHIGLLDIKHNLNSVRYLSLEGDIQKVDGLEFKFASN